MRIPHGMLVAWVVALSLAPMAMAQVPPSLPVADDSLTVEIQPHAAAIPTEKDVDIPYTIAYSVGTPTRGTMDVLVTVDAPAGWLVVPVPDRHATPDAPALPATYFFEGVLRARHDGTPLAFREDMIRVVAAAQGDGATVQPRDASAELALRADWRPGLQVVVQDPDVTLSPSANTGLALGEIRNTGNAPVDVTAAVARVPDECLATIERPSARLGPGERSTLAIDVTCSRTRDAGALVVSLEHALADDPARKGEPVTPSWDVGGEGSSGPRVFGDAPRDTRYNASWGAVALVPAALALAALMRRRPA